ncbi:MAG: Cas10/Cmr2 second palm domain-containing protein [Lachnospiraceae bacterium]
MSEKIMNEIGSNPAVLVMYDVRGIQDFIFRTNKISDVMGASRIIERIVPEALNAAIHSLGITNVLLDWENWEEDKEALRFFTDDSISIQMLYEGGGNALVLFRSKILSSQVNRCMARYVLEKSYSLQLAVATVEVGGNYQEDFRAVTRKMSQIKGESPVSRLTGALPIMDIEESTGFPARRANYFGRKELLSYETEQKRKMKRSSTDEKDEKYLDNLVLKKGIDSSIAIVHIDGNNMGSRIKLLMHDEIDYTSAVAKIRQISKNINHQFKDTFDEMKSWVEQQAQKENNHPNSTLYKKSNTIFVRPLLVAGDDITFLCTACVAMTAVKHFCQQISPKVLYQEDGQKPNQDLYGFSVCAGIAFLNSHFPFHTAYEVAEHCCDSAKKRAKENRHSAEISKDIVRVGNWVDFQICSSVHTANFKQFRKEEYQLFDGSVMTLRPYFLGDPNPMVSKACQDYDFSIFEQVYDCFGNPKKIPRSVAQEFKDAFSMGEHEVIAVSSFAKSRKRELPKKAAYMTLRTADNQPVTYAVWYDALEMLDYYVDLEEKNDNTEESN